MKISIKQIRPGMTISSDVLVSQGQVLVPRNRVVTSEIVNLLLCHNITFVEITDTNIPALNPGQSLPDDTSASPNLPSISIQVSENQMSATLIIEPTGISNSNLTVKDILEVFKRHEITAGIDECLVGTTVVKWNNQKHRYEITDIAKGILPQPAKSGMYQLNFRHLTDETDIKKIRDKHYMWELPDLIFQVQHVIPGNVIAEQQIGIPSIPGKNIKGELVFTDEVVKTEFSTGSGVSYAASGQKVVSDIEGVVTFISGRIEVVHINFDGAVEVNISPDAMVAELVFHKPVDGGSMPGEKAIRNQLLENHITHGIKEDLLREVLSRLAQSYIPENPVVVAEATQSVHGQNGSLNFYFNTETSLKPKVNTDGSVDYKSVNIVNSTTKGQKLVSLIAPSNGIPGTNVCGGLIACQDGTPAKLPVGPNTEPDPSDPNTLLASIDGVVRYTHSIVEVSEGFVIKGNVDFSTGNVQYKGSVVVGGDVKSGFEIECGGDFQVGGTIEDSVLKIGGNVLCRYGFSGQGKGIIDSKGDINLGFMKNQTLRCQKSVNIAHEAINSTIFAKDSIYIHGNPLSVAGGCLSAQNSIIVNTVGNHSGIRTLLEVGFDFSLGDDVKILENHLEELISNQNTIIENLKKIAKSTSFQQKLSLKNQILKTKLTESLNKYIQQIKMTEFRKDMITKKMYNFENAHIKFERVAFPGTLFKFGERHYLVKEELKGPKTVRLVDHEIKVL